MSVGSAIEWTDATWNPTRGCTRVSEGCRNCYAERVAFRISKPGQPYYGIAKVTAPRDDLDRVGGRRDGWTGEVALVEAALDLPLRWRKPRRIFVDSMSDLFHDRVPDEYLDRCFAVMALATQHTFQVLTKRPERMRDYIAGMVDADRWDAARKPLYDAALAAGNMQRAEYIGIIGAHPTWPLLNVWLGVSTENQETADERIPLLLQTPAAVRFVSAEPLLSAIDFAPWLRSTTTHHMGADVEGMLRNRSFDALRNDDGRPMTRREAEDELYALHKKGVALLSCGGCDSFDPQEGCPGHPNPHLDWLIVGGESGPGARPCDVAWIRSIVEQCRAAGIPAFVKQIGDYVTGDPTGFIVSRYKLRDGRWWVPPLIQSDSIKTQEWVASLKAEAIAFRTGAPKGGNTLCLPEDLRVREFPR